LGGCKASTIDGDLRSTYVNLIVWVGGTIPVSSETREIESRIIVVSSSILEKTTGINVSTGISGKSSWATEAVDSIGKSINGISVVEGLGTKNLEEKSITSQRRAIVNVLIGLDNPDELLHGVVEVELDLVRRRTDGLVAGELELANEVLVRVLCHSATFISVEEDVINVQGSGNKRLVVSNCGRHRASNIHLTGSASVGICVTVECGNSPQAFINRADVKVDLDLMVLEGNKRKSKTRVCAEPELEGHIKGCLGESVTRRADLTRSSRVTRGLDIRERGVGDKGKLCGVTNHLEVTALLLRGHCELVPDVHPVTVLAINALATNLNFNLGDELLTWEIKPTGIHTVVLVGGIVSETHELVDLWKCHLKIGAVGKITVTGDHTLNTATEIGLTVESLLNRLNCEVSVSAIGHFPESNLRISCEVHILCTISYELH